MTKYFMALLITLLTGSSAVQAEREVKLKKNVQVSTHLVLLGDLVIDTEELSEAEKNLVILKSPLRGFKNYRPVEIAYEMQNHGSLMDLSLVAPPLIKISRIEDRHFVESVKAGLVKALKKENPWKRLAIEVDFTAEDINKINAMSGADFTLVSQIPHEDLNSAQLRVKFTEKEQSRGTIDLKPRIRRRIFSITLKNNGRKGQIINKSDLIVDQVWVDGNEERYAANFKDCVGFELSKNIAGGSRIPTAFLLEPVYVRKGEIIKVYVETQSMKVGIHAKALTDGRRGETIRAKNTKSGKFLDVTMTDQQTAVIR